MKLSESLKAFFDRLIKNFKNKSNKKTWVLFWLQVALICLLIGTIILIYWVDTGNRFTFYLVLLSSLIVLLCTALILNISEKYKTSLLLTIICIQIAPWISILLDNTVANGDFAPLYFIVLSINFSAIFLSEGVTIIIAVAQLTSLILMIKSSPVLLRGNWISIISFVVFSSVVGIVISSVNRKQLILIEDQKMVLMKNEHKLHELSIRDSLTGLYNRRYMEEVLDRETIQLSNSNKNIGVILVDVDSFKKINDTYGHLSGDSVIVQISEIFLKNSRGSDVVCRFGGDEIIMLLPDCNLENAYQKAEKLRSIINNTKIKINEDDNIYVNISFGVAALPENGLVKEDVLKAADNALYDAKNKGGNRVVVSSSKTDNNC